MIQETTPATSPAREEYFIILKRNFFRYQTFEGTEAEAYKEKILSVSYDTVVSTRNEKEQLEKRVEELEKVILCLFDVNVSVEESKEIALKVYSTINTPSK